MTHSPVTRVLSPFLFIAVLFFTSNGAHSQGIPDRIPVGGEIIVPQPRPEKPVRLVEEHVEVHVLNGLARFKVTQVFRNDSPRRLEGTYVFPIPRNGVISNFALFTGEKRLAGEVIPADEARSIYENIVRKMRDPGLLEYIGQGMLRARVFPVEPRSNKTIELSYSLTIQPTAGTYRLATRLRPDRIQTSALKITAVFHLEDKAPLANIFSPTHPVTITRPSSRKATVNLTTAGDAPADFILSWSTKRKDVDASFLAQRPRTDQAGYFYLSLDPGVRTAGSLTLSKDVIFVLDRSGSMAGQKISQAKDALTYCLNRLNKNDRFALLWFNSTIDSFAPRLQPVSDATRRNAQYEIGNLDASGSTNINEALSAALQYVNGVSERPVYIVFLTDGLPTVGVQDPDVIIRNVEKNNAGKARLFTFGVGYDVDTYLLDKLSQTNGGLSDYVSPDESIEAVISRFFSSISNPALTDISITFSGGGVTETYPVDLPDLFYGSTVIIFGRYRNAGTATVTLRGKQGHSSKKYTYTITFPEREEKRGEIPALWAKRKIGYLLDDMRINGENEEVKNEIIDLSKKYGIVTKYTSYLVTEDKDLADVALEESLAKRRYDAALGYSAIGDAQAKKMVSASKSMQSLKQEARVVYHRRVRTIEGKVFVEKDSTWIEEGYDRSQGPGKVIQFGSRAYFRLASSSPRIRRILALGPKVIFNTGGVWQSIQ